MIFFFFSHANGILNNEELDIHLLYKEYWSKNLDFCYENFRRFSVEDVRNAECLTEFRLRKHDLPLLAVVLQISESFKCYQETVSSRVEADFPYTLSKSHNRTERESPSQAFGIS